MDNSIKQILLSNKVLLIRNIVPCEELYATLRQHEVFSESMLNEIKGRATSEEKNAKMVELLMVRGGNVLFKFIDALQLSGHNFLSDTLREELYALADITKHKSLMEAQVMQIDFRDIFRRFPKLHRLLPNEEKEDFEKFIRDKIKEEAVRQAWKKEATVEKQKAIDAKQKQLEEAIKSSEILQEKDAALSELELTLASSVDETRDLALQIKHLHGYIEELKSQHRNDLGAANTFNNANDSTLRRLTEREAETNKGLIDMKATMEECLEKYGPKQRIRRTSNIDFVEMMSVSHLDYAKAAANKLITLVTTLAHIRERCEALDQERHQALVMLGDDNPSDSSSLTARLRDTLAQQEHIIGRLEIELQELNAELISKKGLEHVVEELDNMKILMDSLRMEVQQKENHNKRLQEELTKTNKSLSVAKYQASKKQTQIAVQRPPSPHLGKPPSPRHATLATPVRMARIVTPYNKVEINIADGSSAGSDDGIEEIKQETPRGPRLQRRSSIVNATATTTTSQGVTLPPLQKEKPQVGFRFLKDNQTTQKGRPMKAQNLATPGATRISTMASNGEPSFRKPGGILSISSVNGGVHATSLDSGVKARPAKQPRFNNLLTAQAGFEIKRGTSFYR